MTTDFQSLKRQIQTTITRTEKRLTELKAQLNAIEEIEKTGTTSVKK